MSLVRLKHRMRRWLQPFLWSFLFIFLVSCFYGYFSRTPMSAEAAAPFAKVAGSSISRIDFDSAADRMGEMFGRTGGLETQWMAHTFAFHSLIDEHLRQAAAQRRGITVDRREAKAARDAEIEMQLQQVAGGMRGSELEEYRARMAAAPEYSIDNYTRRLSSQRLDESLRNGGRPVELQVSQILIRKGTRTTAQTLDEAKRVAERASAPNADFAAIARTASQDDASKAKGGDVGWVKPDSPLPQQVLATAFQMKKGQVSGPIATDQGYYIVKVANERPFTPTKKDPKEAKDETDAYKSQVGQAIAAGFYDLLRRQADIQPVAPLARGLEAEREVGPGAAYAEDSPEGKARLQTAVKAYEEARATESQKPAFTFHLGQLYMKLGDYAKAEKAFSEVIQRVNAAEVQMARAEALEKLNDKAGAVAAYQEASKNAYDQPQIHGQIAEKLKTLGRKDLAVKEEELHKKYLVDQAAEQKRQQAEQKRIMAEQAKAAEAARKKAEADKKAAAAKPAPAAATPAPAPAPGATPAPASPATSAAPTPAPAAPAAGGTPPGPASAAPGAKK